MDQKLNGPEHSEEAQGCLALAFETTERRAETGKGKNHRVKARECAPSCFPLQLELDLHPIDVPKLSFPKDADGPCHTVIPDPQTQADAQTQEAVEVRDLGDPDIEIPSISLPDFSIHWVLHTELPILETPAPTGFQALWTRVKHLLRIAKQDSIRAED